MSDPGGYVLALDLGLCTGWAMRSPAGLTDSGVLKLRGGDRHGYGVRFLDFRRELGTLAGDRLLRCIFYEDVRRHLAVDAAHSFGGFLATLAAWCEAREIRYVGVGVGTWKARMVANGRADKAEVIAAVRSWGYDPEDDNEADALALLEYALRDPRHDAPARPKPKRKSGKEPARRGRGTATAEPKPLTLALDGEPF